MNHCFLEIPLSLSLPPEKLISTRAKYDIYKGYWTFSLKTFFFWHEER